MFISMRDKTSTGKRRSQKMAEAKGLTSQQFADNHGARVKKSCRGDLNVFDDGN